MCTAPDQRYFYPVLRVGFFVGYDGGLQRQLLLAIFQHTQKLKFSTLLFGICFFGGCAVALRWHVAEAVPRN